MREYYYLASERIKSIYNQLNTSTPIEITREQSDKSGAATEGNLGAEGGIFGLVKGLGKISRKTSKERSQAENIRSTIELEHKLDAIEKRFTFVLLEEAIAQKKITVSLPIHFKGAFYCKGLNSPEYYSSDKWDGKTLPILYKNIDGMKIRIPFNPLHLISNTCWNNVHGRPTIDGIGFVNECSSQEVLISPLGFGLFISDELASLLG